MIGHLKEARAPGLPAHSRALAVFVVNRRPPDPSRVHRDEQAIFQVELHARYAEGLLPRSNRRDERSAEWDDKVADLQYRDRVEYAVGHGVSVAVDAPEGGRVRGARTSWMPRAGVPLVATHEVGAVKTSMDELAALPDGQAARDAVAPLLDAYTEWIAGQRTIDVGDSSERRTTQEALMRQAEQARDRIREGIELLAKDADVLAAFRLANRVMADQARHRPDRSPTEQPKWRLFQLAFLLLNVPGVTAEGHPDRDVVDLLFFPTGGGKTEAYLVVIAFSLALRRLRGEARPDRGLGVAVILRYTLRLLTLDQLSRAATLICALEMAERLQRSGRSLRRDDAFREPPAGNDQSPDPRCGIQVLEFPEWFVCQNPECRALVRAGDGLETKGRKYIHTCGRTSSHAVPVRFVMTCRRGHLDDFPWLGFVHGQAGRPLCAAPGLELLEGATGDFSEVRVRCTGCGESRSVSDAAFAGANPTCRGRRPWLGPEGREECSEKQHLLVRTASMHAGHLGPRLGSLRGLDASGVTAVLEAVLAERRARAGPRVELVWTGPDVHASAARDTAVVVRELFAGAERSVIVAGFSFDHGAEILEPLHRAMRDRGVEARLYLELVDERRALVTSANFTDRGQTRNMEVGALIEGDRFAQAFAGQWRRLTEAGLLVRCPVPGSRGIAAPGA